MEMSIFITNLGKYNEGCLIGKWVRLPVPLDKLDAVLAEIGINDEYEEYFITDFESSFVGMSAAVGEFSSVEALNELAETIDGLSTDEEEKLGALLESELCNNIYEIAELVERLDDFDLLKGIDDDEGLGFYYAEECGCLEIPENLKTYFDYEAYGRDIRLESNIIYTTYGCLIDNR